MTMTGNEKRNKARQARCQRAAETLTELGITFETRPTGTSLLIDELEISVTYWPNTGRWVVNGAHGFGQHSLLRLMKIFKRRRKGTTE